MVSNPMPPALWTGLAAHHLISPSGNVTSPFDSGQVSANHPAELPLPRCRIHVSKRDVLAGGGERAAVWAEDRADPSFERGVGAAFGEVPQDDG